MLDTESVMYIFMLLLSITVEFDGLSPSALIVSLRGGRSTAMYTHFIVFASLLENSLNI